MFAPKLPSTSSILIPGLAVLVVLGAVLVGAASLQRGPDASEHPVMAEHAIELPGGATFYAQKYEVSIAEWNACYAAGACRLALRAPRGKADETTPATGLSYVDVGEYLSWINQTTRHDYRLPSLTEWKFMAAEVLPEKPDPLFTSPDLTWASSYLAEPQTKRTLRPRGTFSTTAEGVVDLDGSVWEWTSECYDGAEVGEISQQKCPAFFIGGEHIAAMSYLIRDPARGGCAAGLPPAHLGMRLVSDTAL